MLHLIFLVFVWLNALMDNLQGILIISVYLTVELDCGVILYQKHVKLHHLIVQVDIMPIIQKICVLSLLTVVLSPSSNMLPITSQNHVL